jgi:hypothetical protein
METNSDPQPNDDQAPPPAPVEPTEVYGKPGETEPPTAPVRDLGSGSALPQEGQPAAPAKKKRRGWCFCCLAVLLVPAIALLLLVIWVCSGDAPPPSDCLPQDAPVRVVVREPADLAGRVLRDERLREIFRDESGDGQPGKPLPKGDELEWAIFFLNQILGEEMALAVDPDGNVVGAARPGVLARAAERLARWKIKKDQKFSYSLIGETLVFSRDPERLEAVLARREEILGRKGTTAPPEDVRAEVRFKDLEPLRHSAPENALRAAEFIWDLPTAEKLAGRIRLDRSLVDLSGYLHFPAGKHGAPPALKRPIPRSASLVPADALGYWVWQAPGGAARWSARGRWGRWIESLAADEEDGSGAKTEENLRKVLGFDPGEFVGSSLVGERVLTVVAQQRAGGKPLLPAASLLFECAAPPEAWPKMAKLLQGFYPLSSDGRPPKEGDLEVYPHLVERRYKGRVYLELVYAHYPYGSGYRPAFGTAAGFLVITSSKMELQRMIDRSAGGPAGKTMAGDADLRAATGGGSPAAGVFLLRPQGRGKEIADLCLAMQRGFAEPGKEPGAQATAKAAALGRALSVLESLRGEWRPQKNGSLKIEIKGKLTPPTK